MLPVYALTALAATASAWVTFVHPPPGPDPDPIPHDFTQNEIYSIGDTMDVKFVTNKSPIDLMLWRKWPPSRGQDDPEYQRYELNATPDNYTWTVSLKGFSIDWPGGQDFVHFWVLYSSGDSDPEGGSAYFNITRKGLPKAPDTTSTVPTITTTTVPKASTSTAASTTTSAAAATSTAPAASSGPSGGTIAAVVIGVIFGLAIIGLAGWYLYRRRMRTRREEAATALMSPPDYPTPGPHDRLTNIPHPSKDLIQPKPPVAMVPIYPSEVANTLAPQEMAHSPRSDLELFSPLTAKSKEGAIYDTSTNRPSSILESPILGLGANHTHEYQPIYEAP